MALSLTLDFIILLISKKKSSMRITSEHDFLALLSVCSTPISLFWWRRPLGSCSPQLLVQSPFFTLQIKTTSSLGTDLCVPERCLKHIFQISTYTEPWYPHVCFMNHYRRYSEIILLPHKYDIFELLNICSPSWYSVYSCILYYITHNYLTTP